MLEELEREPDEGMPASPAWSPSIGAEAKYSEVDAKTTLSARQGASKVVSEGVVRGWSGCGACVCMPAD